MGQYLHPRSFLFGTILFLCVHKPGFCSEGKLIPEVPVVVTAKAPEPNDAEAADQLVLRVAKFKPFMRAILRNPTARALFRQDSFVSVGAASECSTSVFHQVHPRLHYRQRVIHPSDYRIFPHRVLVPFTDDESFELIQEGRIYHYEGELGVLKCMDYPTGARIKYANMLLGILNEHPWARHVTPEPWKGLKILMDLYKFSNVPKARMDSNYILEIERSLRFLRGGFGVLMNLAKTSGKVNDLVSLRTVVYNYTQGGQVFPMTPQLREFMIELFLKRQAYLKEHLPHIAQRNGTTMNKVLLEISNRTKVLKLVELNPELLILEKHSTEFFSIEGVLLEKELKEAENPTAGAPVSLKEDNSN